MSDPRLTPASFAKDLTSNEETSKTPKTNIIGDVETTAKAPTLAELEEKQGNMDLTPAQKKAQIDAYNREDTPEKRQRSQKIIKDFYEKIK